jgi:transposase
LKKERTQHRNRIRSLLVLHGLDLEPDRSLLVKLDSVRRWDGTELPPRIRGELEREYARLLMVEEQRNELLKAERARLKEPTTASEQKAAKLVRLRGLGERSAWPLVTEFFWRTFRNRKEVGGASGLVATPWLSGGIAREQGLSKAGNKRVRALMVEIAWLWVRHQPENRHTKWFNEKYAPGSRRMRKVGIAAVARKLLVDLWRYLEHDVVPDGAVLSV